VSALLLRDVLEIPSGRTPRAQSFGQPTAQADLLNVVDCIQQAYIRYSLVVADEPSATVQPVRLADLCPFVSLLLLQIDEADAPDRVFHDLVKRATKRRQTPGTEVAVVAVGLEERALSQAGASFDQGAATIWQRRRSASWATEGSRYTDVEHELFLCLRRELLIAVFGPDAVRRAVERWIDTPPRPPIRRVKAGVVNASMLADGDVKTMWLRHVRGRSIRRPDAKTLSGVDLVSALDPIGDGSYALGAARVALPDVEDRSAFTGTVGATPRKSRIWSGPTADAVEFLTAVDEALGWYNSPSTPEPTSPPPTNCCHRRSTA
jgi:hypothetical protein